MGLLGTLNISCTFLIWLQNTHLCFLPISWSPFLLWEILPEHPINYFLFGALGVQGREGWEHCWNIQSRNQECEIFCKIWDKVSDNKETTKNTINILVEKNCPKILEPLHRTAGRALTFLTINFLTNRRWSTVCNALHKTGFLSPTPMLIQERPSQTWRQVRKGQEKNNSSTFTCKGHKHISTVPLPKAS